MHLRFANIFVFSGLVLLLGAGCNVTGNNSPSPRGGEAYEPGDQRLRDPYGNNSALTTQGITADSGAVFVAIGGWNSCVEDPRIPGQPSPWGMNMNKGFSKLVKQLQARSNGQPVKFVMACHNPDASVARYVLSTDPSRLRVGPHNQMYQEIGQFAQSTNSPVVILGHSYGGAFAMQAALAMPPQVAIAQLLTIDGISPVNCPPATMAKLLVDRLSQITGLGDSSGGGIGCQQSPREFNASQKQTIRGRVGWWQNYHQNDLLSILKADAIPEACNTPVKHDDIKSFINGHIAMGMYDKLWRDITSRLTSPIPAGCLAAPI